MEGDSDDDDDGGDDDDDDDKVVSAVREMIGASISLTLSSP